MRSRDFVLLATTVAFTGLVLAVRFEGVDAGFVCQNGLIPPFVPCDLDCKEQHYSSQGTCFNGSCFCNGTGVPASSSCTYGFTLLGEVPYTCQCRSNATSVETGAYNALCNTDCQCNHGAASGTCNWDVRQCICDWPNNFVDTSTYVNTAVCAAYTFLGSLNCLIGLATTGTLPTGC